MSVGSEPGRGGGGTTPPSGAANARAYALAGAAAGVGHGSAGNAAPLNSTSPRSGNLLGLRVPPDVEQGGLLATLTLLCGMLLIALVIGDAAGVGPRHTMWRASLRERLGRR